MRGTLWSLLVFTLGSHSPVLGRRVSPATQLRASVRRKAKPSVPSAVLAPMRSSVVGAAVSETPPGRNSEGLCSHPVWPTVQPMVPSGLPINPGSPGAPTHQKMPRGGWSPQEGFLPSAMSAWRGGSQVRVGPANGGPPQGQGRTSFRELSPTRWQLFPMAAQEPWDKPTHLPWSQQPAWHHVPLLALLRLSTHVHRRESHPVSQSRLSTEPRPPHSQLHTCREELTQQHQDTTVRRACLPRAAWPRTGMQGHRPGV